MEKLGSFYHDKTILVTGGAGSIGSEIVRKILGYKPKVVRILDNNETGLFELEHELESEKIRTFVGDVRDKERLKRAVENVNIIFHAAALKHVPLCEYNPFEAVKTNAIGTENLLEVAIDGKVEKFITISTDKAVNPINVMGATKLLAERLTISANFYKGLRKTALSCVRFGNVLYSRGSVLPLFEEQVKKGFITLTNSQMTRFIMKKAQAVHLILKATKIARGGELFILKMPTVRIKDLAEVMIKELKLDRVKIKNIGKRAGEKMYEELMTEEEAENAYEDAEMFIVLPKSFDSIGMIPYRLPKNFKKAGGGEYSSKNLKLLAKKEIRTMIRRG